MVVGHNSESHLGEMLQSLVDQIDQADEIIYYDDCSSDSTLEILESFQSRLPQLKVFKGDSQKGVSRARNIANSLATSEFIAVLDSDDLYREDTILRYRTAIEAAPTVDLHFADTIVFHSDLERGNRRRYPAFTDSSDPVHSLMLRPVVPFKHSSTIYRKSAIENVKGYNESLDCKVDFEMLIRFIRSGSKIAKLDQVTSYHRTHPQQMSRDRLKGIFSYWSIIDQHEPRTLHAFYFKTIKGIEEVAKLLLGR